MEIAEGILRGMDTAADVAVELELPPGSMVYINARIYHGIAPKPATPDPTGASG